MSVIQVQNEIGVLKKVLVHRPGGELLNMTPDILTELLFDDIPFLKNAQQEHDAFVRIMEENGVEVVYLVDLVAEALDAHEGLRFQFVDQLIAEGRVSNRRYSQATNAFLKGIANSRDLVSKAIAGVNLKDIDMVDKISLNDLISDPSRLILPPMPNLYFQRDPMATVGNGVVINHMQTYTRSQETILAEYIFKYHPDYLDHVPQYYHREDPFTIEGGDILNISEHVLAVGLSERTEADAIETLAKNLFQHPECAIDTVLAFDIPKARAYMHLDTVFTQIDHNLFTVHPGILGTLRVFELTKPKRSEQGDLQIREIEDTLENVLSHYLQRDIELILCGGGDRIAAEREQWNDGSNTFCIAPGTIIVYDRNEITNEIFKDRGLRVIEMPSGELSRGRGGPRCMSMPLVRE